MNIKNFKKFAKKPCNFQNTKAISITLDNVKKEGRKTIVLFLGFFCIVALLVFGLISYIR